MLTTFSSILMRAFLALASSSTLLDNFLPLWRVATFFVMPVAVWVAAPSFRTFILIRSLLIAKVLLELYVGLLDSNAFIQHVNVGLTMLVLVPRIVSLTLTYQCYNVYFFIPVLSILLFSLVPGAKNATDWAEAFNVLARIATVIIPHLI